MIHSYKPQSHKPEETFEKTLELCL